MLRIQAFMPRPRKVSNNARALRPDGHSCSYHNERTFNSQHRLTPQLSLLVLFLSRDHLERFGSGHHAQ